MVTKEELNKLIEENTNSQLELKHFLLNYGFRMLSSEENPDWELNLILKKGYYINVKYKEEVNLVYFVGYIPYRKACDTYFEVNHEWETKFENYLNKFKKRILNL